MIEKEQLIEFLDGIVMKEDLSETVTIEQVEEINKKLVARLDVQQGQLDGLQSLMGAMQVKMTQMQIQLVRMEELLVAKESEMAAARENAATIAQQQKTVVNEPEPGEPTTAKTEFVKEEPVKEEPVKQEPAKPEPVKEQPDETTAPAGPQTIADAIKGEESLADKLSKNIGHETVASSLNSSKIERIQTAITLADRFRFQRELFAGDAVKMAEVLEILNKMKSMDEAVAYIEKTFTWDYDLQVTKDFLRIIERRF